MNQRNPKRRFDVFVAASLARALPYRKKALIFGPQVCEFAAVLPMGTAAFFLAGSLGLVNKAAAEEVLAEAAAPRKWQEVFGSGIKDSKARAKILPPGAATFDAVFPEVSKIPLDRARQLLSPEECVASIVQRVQLGLLWGVLFPEMMLSMLRAWVSQAGKSHDLGVGGLKFQDTPLLTSVEEAYAAVRSMYEAWTES